MPVGRRASASAGHVVSAAPSAPGSSRNHRPNDSQSAHAQTTTTGSYPPLAGGSTNPHQKMISVLVTRLKNKLPCYSGMHLSDIEADEAMQQAIETLVELSRDALDVIAWALTGVLDKLSKEALDENGQFTRDVLQSQLLVLKVLSVAMGSRWRHSSDSRPATRNGDNGSGYSTPLDSPSHTLMKSARVKPSREFLSSPPPAATEPAPIEENCARYILSVMVLFLRRTAHIQIGREDSSVLLQDYETEEQLRSPLFAFGAQDGFSTRGSLSHAPNSAIRNQPSAASFGSEASRVPIPLDTLTYTPTAQSLADSASSLNDLIAKTVGSIVYHLSASNWPIVFSRVRNKIHALEHDKAGLNPDVTDLELMALSALDRTRLVQLLQEISSLLLSMKRDTQIAIAVPLGKAVWHWIDLHPEEFVDAISSPRRMEGAPERAFDLFYHQQEATEHRATLSPVLTILMCVSHERLKHDFNLHAGGARQSNRKEVFLVEAFFKHINSNSSFAATALRCLVDICKAAARARPNQDVPLRSLAGDVAHEIRRFLLSGSAQQPFWNIGEEIDVPLYSDALVACFRFLPEEDSLPLFTGCLEAERSEAVKLCALTACRSMLQDSKKFIWHKDLSNIGKGISGRLRVIFKHAASRRDEIDDNVTKRAAVRPRSKGSVNRKLTDRDLLLIGLVALWRADPPTYFRGLQESTSYNNLDWVPLTATPWDGPSEVVVKVAISRSFLFLMDTVYALQPGNPDIPAALSWLPKITPHYLFTISGYLMSARLDFEAQELWIGIIGDLLKLYTRRSEYEHVQVIQSSPDRFPAFHVAEIALLVSLTSASSKVAVAAAQCLRVLASAERLHTRVDKGAERTETVEAGIARSLYDQLGDPQMLVLGRVGLHKRIRKVVSRLATVHPIHMIVWQECFFRWTQVGYLYLKFQPPVGDDGRDALIPKQLSTEDLHHQWRNLTLFLAAFGAPCTPDQPYAHDALSKYLPPENLPDSAKILMDPNHMVDTFLENIISLLVSREVGVRDVAREALGMELAPRLYPKLYKHINTVVSDVTRVTSAPWNDEIAVFLDQFIAVLKSIFEAAGQTEMSVDFGTTLVMLAQFFARYNDEPAVARARVKFCALVESGNKRFDKPSPVRRDNNLAHEVLDVITEWVQDPATLRLEHAICAQQDVNMACLRAMVSAFERGALPSFEINGEDGNNYGNPRLFLRYSSVLSRLLDYGRPEVNDHDSQYSYGSRPLAKDYLELRQLVSAGLVHLVSNNAESALRHHLDMAYDPDPTKRTLFAQVFARALTKGAKFEPSESQSLNDGGRRLRELVKGSNMLVALAICDTCPPSEIDAMIPVLFDLFNTRRSLMDLLKAVIMKEVKATDDDSNLFRANTICTRMLSYFGRTHGLDYLRSLVIPLVKLLSEMPPERGFDLDPNRVGQDQATENLDNVKMIASSFLDIISSSVHTLPSMFREICAFIASAVTNYWPGAKFAALGSFIFLRFISPAVVTPSTIDVEVPPNEAVRRGLMLMGKIVQNLANNIFFGKEAHMAVLNPYLKENISIVTRFLSEVNKFSQGNVDTDPDEWLGVTQDETDTIVLRRYFEKHADKIGKELLSTSNISAQDSANGKTTWDDLCAAIIELGTPNVEPKLSGLDSWVHEGYADLMERYNHRNTDPVRDMWIEAPMPSDQPAVFVMLMRKIEVEALDFDLLLYHVLKVLTSAPYSSRHFKVIFDFTFFTSGAELPTSWLRYTLEMFPVDVRRRMEATYLLNLNDSAHKWIRKMNNVFSGIASRGDVKAYSSLADLRQELSEEAIIPLADAATLEAEPSSEFSDVRLRQSSQLSRLVNLKIGTTHLRITSAKTSPLTTLVSSKTTDFILMSEISDVYQLSGGTGVDFIIRRRNGVTMYFASTKREEIVKLVRDARGKVRVAHPFGAQRGARQSNVYATLLHIGLSNLCHDDHELKEAALELLRAVCSDMNIDDGIASNSGLTVPVYPDSFVQELSEELATRAPQLTLDFISEVVGSLDKMNGAAKMSNVRFVAPWIKNLVHFVEPSHALYDHSGSRVRDCIRTLVDATTSDQEHYLILHKFVWTTIGELDGQLVAAVLEELMRAGIDVGSGSPRCQRVCDTVAVLSSLTVLGRVLSRLRKVLGKTSIKPSRTLAENVNWSEISALSCLALAAGSQVKGYAQAQLYIPEIAHLVTMVGATGETIVRRTMYFMVVNRLETFYALSITDDSRPVIADLLSQCREPQALRAFGLARPNAAGSYVDWTPGTLKDGLDTQEELARIIIRMLEVTSGSQGLLNVWRARWMSLATSSAFQLSPCIQARAFVVIGMLATSEVDDDLLYQMLVAIKTALTQCDESETTAVVSMLRCLCRIIPSLKEYCRYLPGLFWLAVSLLECGLVPFFEEAAQLLRVILEAMDKQGAFADNGMSSTLLNHRAQQLEDQCTQLDNLVGISFEASFSFALVATIFRGVRVNRLRPSVEALLRCLLRITVKTEFYETQQDPPPISSEAVAYFLALVSFSTTHDTYRTLLEEANVNEVWIPTQPRSRTDSHSPPRIPFDLLGVADSQAALLVTSFAALMLSSAQGDDAESEMLYTTLSDLATAYPEIVGLAYEGLQERIKDTFASSVNPAIINAASTIFRISSLEASRHPSLRNSASNLGTSSSYLSTVDEFPTNGPGKRQMAALTDLCMAGLASRAVLHFLPVGQNRADAILQEWIPNLVGSIIQ